MRAVNLLPPLPPETVTPPKPGQRGLARMEEADVIIVGAPSSGNRLLNRLLQATGKTVVFDRTHGRLDLPPEKVLRLTRDPAARSVSVLDRNDMKMFERITTIEEAEVWVETTDARVEAKYPDAPVVTYEALVADVQVELDRVARIIGVEKFVASEEVVDRNAVRLGGIR